TRRIESINAWHAGIENHNVRFQGLGLFKGFATVHRLAAHFPPWSRCHEFTNSTANLIAIIGYENTGAGHIDSKAHSNRNYAPVRNVAPLPAGPLSSSGPFATLSETKWKVWSLSTSTSNQC